MLNRTRLSALTFILLITVAGLSFTAWSARARSQQSPGTAITIEDAATPVPPVSPSQLPGRAQEPDTHARGAAENRLETEVLTITSTGFEPAEITRPAGPFILAVHNQSGEAGPALRLDRVHGNKLIEVRMARWRRAVHRQLNPPAGEYLLSLVDHPERNCRITITSN
jgi:hypothetical protein